MSAAPEGVPAETDVPLLRIRVSRDSGRTWGEPRTYWAAQHDVLIPLFSSQWPPCGCPRCREPQRERTWARPVRGAGGDSRVRASRLGWCQSAEVRRCTSELRARRPGPKAAMRRKHQQ